MKQTKMKRGGMAGLKTVSVFTFIFQTILQLYVKFKYYFFADMIFQDSLLFGYSLASQYLNIVCYLHIPYYFWNSCFRYYSCVWFNEDYFGCLRARVSRSHLGYFHRKSWKICNNGKFLQKEKTCHMYFKYTLNKKYIYYYLV